MQAQYDEKTFKKAVGQALELDPNDVTPEMALGSVPAWDSLNHMNLIIAVEEAFGVRFESEEIPKLQTIAALRQALLKHLGND